ncbi:probable RNA methyltransferase CG11342 [Drosophila eugracilis]|uniref:probable RNA methyltransferase CG11342 n=1 Tax=Drosophila eugracilis TaxID=29029 RepID=UPI0007E76000|nr:probable RNA methyltransferase CG11342 [Drosophila eugracilis]
MEIRNNDPGAVQYGNFMNYYQFNSASERVKLLPDADIWLSPLDDRESSNKGPYYVMDVGCNCGVFTQLLHKYLEERLQRCVKIFGVDIDDRLIQRAKSENEDPKNISYACVDVLDDNAFESVKAYLKIHSRQKFDAICCYSITMWIHLNHHDQGLQLFLKKLGNLAELLVVEPQPWKCYQTAQRRLKKAGEDFPLFLELKWRSDVDLQIENYLEKTLDRRKIFESTPTKWQRKICFYRGLVNVETVWKERIICWLNQFLDNNQGTIFSYVFIPILMSLYTLYCIYL